MFGQCERFSIFLMDMRVIDNLKIVSRSNWPLAFLIVSSVILAALPVGGMMASRLAACVCVCGKKRDKI